MSAYEAMYEAQKIAYAPVIFQVVRALRDLGILSLLEQSGKTGMGAAAIGKALDISPYGVETLLESGLSCDVVEYKNDITNARSDIVKRSKPFFVGRYTVGELVVRQHLTWSQRKPERTMKILY